MSEIYILDGNLPKINQDVIRTYIQAISPKPPMDIVPTAKGLIVSYANDMDCNFIYEHNTDMDLRNRQLTALLRGGCHRKCHKNFFA